MENVQKVQTAFTTVYDALEKANKSGVFTLAESSNVLSNTLVLKEYLQTTLNQVVANLQQQQKQQQQQQQKRNTQKRNVLKTIDEVYEENESSDNN